MSTINYFPNYPDTTTVYKIGTEGLEHAIEKDTSRWFSHVD